MSLLGVDVPPISNVTIWGSGLFGFNKTAAIYCFASLATIVLFMPFAGELTKGQSLGALVRAVEVPRLVGSNKLLDEATGWAPEIPLEHTLLDVLEDARNAL